MSKPDKENKSSQHIEPKKREKIGFMVTTKQLFHLLSVPRMVYFIPFFLSLIRSAVVLATPYYYKTLIDLIPYPEQFYRFTEILWILIFLNIMGVILNILTQRSFQHLGIKTIFDLRNKIFMHLQKLSLSFHHKHKAGETMAFITNDAESVNGLISSALINLVLSAIQLIGCLIFMIFLSWQISIILFITIPTIFTITRIFSIQAHKRVEKERKTVNEITAQTQEIMDGLRTIRDLRIKNVMLTKFQKWVDQEVDGRFYAQRLWSIMIPFNNFFAYLSIGLAVLLGARLAIDEIITLGTLFAFIMYFQQFSGPLQQIAQFFSDIQRALIGGQHILELLKTESEIQESPSPIVLTNPQGQIEFSNVTFAYEKTEDVLKDISVEIEAKQKIAIVGPTGAGKTTFASLIPRFYDIKQGEIKLDGHNIKEYSLSSLRNKIGIVLQDSFLFNESIMNNIRFGRPNATDEEIFTITKRIGIHDFITKLPKGYNNVVGERGVVLSVGQCQLIAIARTLLSDPPILILDEATSSVDAYSEVLIQNALDELLKKRTSIVIAHRFSTISSSDKILVMDKGEIIQKGTHTELINQPGMYQKFYHMQFAENKFI